MQDADNLLLPLTLTHKNTHTHSSVLSPAAAACKALGKISLFYKYTPLKPDNVHQTQPRPAALMSISTSCIFSTLFLVAAQSGPVYSSSS